jgi:hypothetical protein
MLLNLLYVVYSLSLSLCFVLHTTVSEYVLLLYEIEEKNNNNNEMVNKKSLKWEKRNKLVKISQLD